MNPPRHERPEYATVLMDRRTAQQDLTLTYRIPEALRGQLRPGLPVVAPLRRERATGYVLRVSYEPEGPADAHYRDLIGVIDDAPDIPEPLLALAHWIAAEYHSPLAYAARLLVPEGASPRVVRQFTRAPRPSDGLSLFGDEPPVSDIEAALSEGPLSLADLSRALGREVASEDMDALERRGIVYVSHTLEHARTRERFAQGVELTISRAEAEAEAELLARRARRQAEVLRVLVREDGPVALRSLGTATPVISGLVGRGFIRRVQIAVRRRPRATHGIGRDAAGFTLTPAQSEALTAIVGAVDAGLHEVVLLHGVTGSGKTEVYLRAIEHAVRQGKRAIVLVPEIALTPQTQALFSRRFPGDTAVLHSGLSPGERLDEWYRIRRGECSVVLGARSAVFAPLEDVGLIVVDEEHETSYKQDRVPRYHARDVARERARQAGAVVVLGSATPSLETTHAANTGDYLRIRLINRVAGAELPSVEIVDMRREKAERKRVMLSERLIATMGERLERQEQIILFLNRRGYSPFLLCRQCGASWRCPNCDISLTFHKYDHTLRCHHCDLERPAPTVCENCESPFVLFQGTGTERVHAEVQEFFPGARILRMDRDTVSTRGAHARILSAFARGEADILTGTQMIAKGLDFPRVTLVGVILADTGLGFSDFRAAEYTFQLLTQVSGRAGRSDLGGQVVIQTFRPDHYAIKLAARHDYEAFAERELANRAEKGYPPYRRFANLMAVDKNEATAQAVTEACGEALRVEAGRTDDVTVLGPAPAPLRRINAIYRWHVSLFAPEDRLQPVLSAALAQMEPSMRDRVIVDIDPSSTL